MAKNADSLILFSLSRFLSFLSSPSENTHILCDMKTLLLILALAMSHEDSLRVMFWNLENFFDWRNDSTSVSDAEFSSQGARHWTRKRFQTKCNTIAKSILWVAENEGALPDVIGLAEVENARALHYLIQNTALEKLDYKAVHFDSPDRRGIDVALLYRSTRLRLKEASPCHLYSDSTIMQTRDILLAVFFTGSGDSLAVLVNHHPSKYGGAALSEYRREVAVNRLKSLSDSLLETGHKRIVAIGDFNDTPDNPLYETLDSILVNLSLPLQRSRLGTIRYNGEWELIDLCFVSRPISGASTLKILYIPFLMVPDRTHGGMKLLRTYSGPKYLGGVSDHCPIMLTI